jgi:hypothetical protein
MNKRKNMPTIEDICQWYRENPPEWLYELFPGFDGALFVNSELFEQHCWLTKSPGDIQRCHMVPDALGGSNHPSNFVLLKKRVHARCPNTSDKNIFINWLLAEQRMKRNQLINAIELVFPGGKQEGAWNLAIVMWWCFDKKTSIYDLTGIESTTAFITEQADKNPFIELLFVCKKFMDDNDLWKCESDELKNKLSLYERNII